MAKNCVHDIRCDCFDFLHFIDSNIHLHLNGLKRRCVENLREIVQLISKNSKEVQNV
jgi:hypothetical protein